MRQGFLSFQKKSQCQDYLSATVILKDEGLYIEEWIEFHRLAGVERFYIYDNNSTDNIKQLLKPYIQEGIVVYHEWPKHPGQDDAYNHALANYGRRSVWIAFFDADEFLFGAKEDNLKDILKRYGQYSGVCVNWVCMASSGHIKRPQGPVIENFIQRPVLDFKANKHVKSIVQPSRVQKALPGGHTFIYKNADWPVTEDLIRLIPGVDNFQGSLSEKNSVNIIRINHYIIKSKEECEVKLKRTMAGKVGNARGANYFPHFDKNMEKDVEILRFLPKLKEKLALKKDKGVLPVDFDWKQYVGNYSDLQKAGIITKEMAETHWLKHGCFENRNYRKKV